MKTEQTYVYKVVKNFDGIKFISLALYNHLLAFLAPTVRVSSSLAHVDFLKLDRIIFTANVEVNIVDGTV